MEKKSQILRVHAGLQLTRNVGGNLCIRQGGKFNVVWGVWGRVNKGDVPTREREGTKGVGGARESMKAVLWGGLFVASKERSVEA